MSLIDTLMRYLNPEPDPSLEAVFAHQQQQLPVVWLLGNTGAGKSSLIRTITADSQVEIGNGFQPCTASSMQYAFPAERPLLTFLDTRGLGEAGYDAADDIDWCQARSHALVVVMKLTDMSQQPVLSALQQIADSRQGFQLLLVQTGCEQLAAEARTQALHYQRQQLDACWRQPYRAVVVDFEPLQGEPVGLDGLRQQLAEMLPVVAQLQSDNQHSDQEAANFSRLRTEVLWYAGAAAASDAVPAVGLVAVPGIQAKMLHSLASRYGVAWDRRALGEFIAALGAGFGVQYAGNLGVRQLSKLIPGYGQTVGAALAATVSFAATWALGRVACHYLYHKSRGEPIDEQALQAMYKQAFDSMKRQRLGSVTDKGAGSDAGRH
ncbi:MAG: GTP-binding DUF697 domain-containing protein [Marinobacterium sp.]|nr:GTP-binding DUF697 domain-containing protein [Marinobacterium sp.]